MDRPTIGKVLIIGVRAENRAISCADSARCAFCFVHVTRFFQKCHREVPGHSGDFSHRGIGDDFDVRMSGRLDEPGSQYSDRTVVRGKGLIKGGHDAGYPVTVTDRIG